MSGNDDFEHEWVCSFHGVTYNIGKYNSNVVMYVLSVLFRFDLIWVLTYVDCSHLIYCSTMIITLSIQCTYISLTYFCDRPYCQWQHANIGC